MKHILAPILLLVFLFPSLALSEEVVEWSDLVEREGVYYKKGTDVPFTGEVTTYERSGRVYSKGFYRNGKEDGPYIAYYEGDQLRRQGHYKNGKEEGWWVYYHNDGSVWVEGTYKDGAKVN